MSDVSPNPWVRQALQEGIVIPAHPLALTKNGKLDERRQRALSRYYLAAGAQGLAVGVHTTQFEIRDPKHGLYREVVALAGIEVDEHYFRTRRKIVSIAGICGRTRQALQEANVAGQFGYDVGLVSLSALARENEDALLAHCQAVSETIPIMGFYLQPAVGGRRLSLAFWRRFAQIKNIVGIKIAPFNRYQTLDVVRAVAESGRAKDIALYTGNDDHIVHDLLTEYAIPVGSQTVRIRFAGGLLGHWACWTRKAVRLLQECKRLRSRKAVPRRMLTLAEQVTDCNAAFFDARNEFAGCIPGIHEVLRRQGLLATTRCLDPTERLSPGQKEEIDRVYKAYPHLNDDAFVAEHLDEWLSG